MVEGRFVLVLVLAVLANASVLVHALLSPAGAFPDRPNNLEVCSTWTPQGPLKPV